MIELADLQKQIAEVGAQEQRLVESAAIYGEPMQLAMNYYKLLEEFNRSVDGDIPFFPIFVTQVRKHALLAILSAVRRHHVQAMCDLRQVVESGCLAAFSIAHAIGNDHAGESHYFTRTEGSNDIQSKKRLHHTAFSWLDEKFPAGSLALKTAKEQINIVAHPNIVYAFLNVHDKNTFSFFDTDKNDQMVRGDLWFIGYVCKQVMDLFYGVNEVHKKIIFSDNFSARLSEYQKKEMELKSQFLSTLPSIG